MMLRMLQLHVCFFYNLDCRAFDVEMLYIAQQLGMTIKEVPVNWQEIDGTSVYN